MGILDSKIRVAIDDAKECPYADVLIRNGDLAEKVMRALIGSVSDLYIDHDLGDHVPNGFEILNKLLGEALCPEYVQVISMNPVGKQRMENLLADYGYIKIGSKWGRVD